MRLVFAITGAASGAQWQAVATQLNTATDDGRIIEGAGFSWREPPLALMYQGVLADGHEGSIQAGTITRIWTEGDLVMAEGSYLDTPEAQAVAGLVGDEATATGLSVSVDLSIQKAVQTLVFPGEAIAEEDTAEQTGEDVVVEIPVIDTANEVFKVQESKMIGLTIVSQPAFDKPVMITNLAWEQPTPEPVAAAAGQDVRMALAVILERLEEDTVFVTELLEALKPPEEEPVAITAAANGAPLVPPNEWFSVPEPDAPTALVITDDGQVYGHLAYWDSCHTGHQGRCLAPPRNASGDYPLFNLGEVETTDGMVTVGQLTIDADHPELELSASQAKDHYAHTALAVADVHIVDGEHGPWLSGAIRPDAEPEKIRVLRASKLSGDWRPWHGSLELIAALATNSPGYPVPRALLAAASNGEPEAVALVSAGAIPPTPLTEDEALRGIRVWGARADGVPGLLKLVG